MGGGVGVGWVLGAGMRGGGVVCVIKRVSGSLLEWGRFAGVGGRGGFEG